MTSRIARSLSVIIAIIVLVSATFASAIIILTGFFGSVEIAKGQKANPTLTREQKKELCALSDEFINSSESKVCGIPKTVKPSANTTVTRRDGPVPDTFVAPSMIPLP